MARYRSISLGISSLFILSCHASELDHPVGKKIQRILPVPCQISVGVNGGTVTVDVESDPAVPPEADKSYVFNVLQCEMGNGPLEALKAQAVEIRSAIFYKFYRYGQTTVTSGTSFQVYSCTRNNTPAIRQLLKKAALETAGQILSWKNFVVWGTFTTGTPAPTVPDVPGIDDDIEVCKKSGGSNNWGLSGCNIHWTAGLPPSPASDCDKWAYVYNRGASVAHGIFCLANRGWTYDNILKFYYGADAYLRQVEYSCKGAALGPIDTFCGGKKNQAWYCYDNKTRVYCRTDKQMAEGLEICDDQCQEGGGTAVKPATCIGGSHPPNLVQPDLGKDLAPRDGGLDQQASSIADQGAPRPADAWVVPPNGESGGCQIAHRAEPRSSAGCSLLLAVLGVLLWTSRRSRRSRRSPQR